MRNLKTSVGGLVLIAIAPLAAEAGAATEQVLYSFPSKTGPFGRLEQDGTGALYGTATYIRGKGAIYRLWQQNAVWQFKNLFRFDGVDGKQPFAGLVSDRAKAIFYGVTVTGGVYKYGTVYSFAPSGGGGDETVLHDFSFADGSSPGNALYRDKTTGSLFGITFRGGATSCGTVFQLTQSGGDWGFSTLYSFQGNADGCLPNTQLKPGPNAESFVGATNGGGNSGFGTIFEVKKSHGIWRESVIHTFSGGSDGVYPADLDEAPDGTIYGVALRGGNHNGNGVIFQLIPNHRRWTYRVIWSFRGTDGSGPIGINFDGTTGALYGTTQSGGAWGQGTVFELAYDGSSWRRTTLHNFLGGAEDGASPQSRPILVNGILYGTTVAGGTNNGGVFYSVQP